MYRFANVTREEEDGPLLICSPCWKMNQGSEPKGEEGLILLYNLSRINWEVGLLNLLDNMEMGGGGKTDTGRPSAGV